MPFSIDQLNSLFPNRHFRNIKEIGKGSTCVVYEVNDGTHSFALKVGEKRVLARPNEISMLKAVNDYVDHKILGDTAFLLMRYKPGFCLERVKEHLHESKEAKNVSPEKIAFQVIFALYELHKKRIIHNDVNMGSAIYNIASDSVSFVDFSGAIFMGDEILQKKQDQNLNFKRIVPYSYQSDITSASENILQHLSIKNEKFNKIITSMRQGPQETRPSVQMVLFEFYLEAMKNKLEVTNNTQKFPDEETCQLIHRLLEALRDYQSNVLKTIKNSLFDLSISHGTKSAAVAKKLSDDLVTCSSKEEVILLLKNFVSEYTGSNRKHSLKVLLASKYFNQDVPNTSSEREKIVNEFVSAITMENIQKIHP